MFYAQLESAQVLHPQRATEIVDLCFTCHGVIGAAAVSRRYQGSKLFTEEFIYATPATDPAHAEYGALVRHGISCTACHHIVDDGAGSIVPI